jgi:opacity protein-like surface antigen
MSSFKRTAVVVASAAAVLLPATAAAAQDPEIPAEGWEYSEQWDFVQDEYTAEANAEIDEILGEHFEDWTFDNSLPTTRLQNYFIDGQNETPVHRKFRTDYYVDQTGEGLEVAMYLPGGISTGYQDLTGGAELDMHYLLHCQEDDTECGEEELEDGGLLAWTTDGTYVDAAVFHPDGSVVTVWWGLAENGLDVTTDDIIALATDLDTEPVWEALEADGDA